MQMTTESPEQTRDLGCLLGRVALPGAVVLLSGELGAGKTCFAQGVAAGLEVSSETPVTSPSYSLMNIYEGRLPFYHFDLYRLSQIDDLTDLGYDEFAGQQGLTLVEWADRIGASLDANLSVEINKIGAEQRQFSFRALDVLGTRLLGVFEKALEADRATPSFPQESP